MVVQWLEQVHGIAVVEACGDGLTRCGDAVYVDTPGFAGAVLTADCLPVLFASRTGRRVAAAHAGWRGLAAGVLENTLARFPESPAQISVWLGPAIGPCHFEVGAEVRETFLTSTPATAASRRLLEQAFRPSASPGRFFADLYALARIRLAACGVTQVSGGSECTFCNTEQFYSYRRDARTGRFVSLIGLAPDQA